MERKPKVVLAKPGLDGHDKGVRLIAMALRDAGIDVVYLGLRQSVEQIVQAAVAEQADFIGLSILSGTHLNVAERMLAQMRQAGIGNVPLTIGGIIPPQDEQKLKEMGVAQVFPVGASFDTTVNWILAHTPASLGGVCNG